MIKKSSNNSRHPIPDDGWVKLVLLCSTHIEYLLHHDESYTILHHEEFVITRILMVPRVTLLPKRSRPYFPRSLKREIMWGYSLLWQPGTWRTTYNSYITLRLRVKVSSITSKSRVVNVTERIHNLQRSLISYKVYIRSFDPTFVLHKDVFVKTVSRIYRIFYLWVQRFQTY